MRSSLLAFLASLLRLATLLLVVGMVVGMLLAFFGHPVVLHWLLVLGPFAIAVVGILAILVLWGLSDMEE